MNRLSSKFIAILFLIGVSMLGYSQTREELEKRKQKLTQDIAYKNKLLEETKKNQKASLNELVLLNRKIKMRQELISTISKEIFYLEGEIEKTNSIIRSLEDDLKRYKEEYAQLIYNTFKTRSSYEKIMYIFASEDLNQAYRRMKYLQQYAQYRQTQAELIERTKRQLNQKNEELKAKIEQKQSLLNEEKNEQNSLVTEKSLQQNVYQTLQSKEQQLRKEIEEQRKEAERLTKAIKRAIEEELKRQAEAKKKSGFALTPEVRALSEDFQSNKGKLPWPVEQGVITQGFGEHPHPVLHEVKIQNNGVNIGTSKGADVRSVFAGVVSGVLVFPGAGKAILVRHGEYLTVYSNLAEVYVQKGDNLELKQPIGKVLTDPAKGKTEVHFEVWKGQTTLNPSFWLFEAN